MQSKTACRNSNMHLRRYKVKMTKKLKILTVNDVFVDSATKLIKAVKILSQGRF